MDTAIAMDYIAKRMAELGYIKYYVRLRHFVLAPGEIRAINGSKDVYLLVQPVQQITINSDFGFYDLLATTANELQYEHTGKIMIVNYSADPNHVRMIQAIPSKR